MSQFVKGQVFKVYPKTFPGKAESYSVKLEDNPIYYRMGTRRFAGIAESGNVIEFSATPNTDGKSANVDGDVKLSAPAAVAATGTPALSGSARDNSIQYQSSRKDALEFVGLIVKTDAVKLPAKQAAKLVALTALVDQYTASFFEDINTLGAVTRELEGGAAPASGEGESEEGVTL